jgi:dienelactone hydrolase
MAEFRDRTGRPGPATWSLGSYPEGEGALPVAGVSWYEASAFAVFDGKTLPTVHHWARAAFEGRIMRSEPLRLGNFSSEGLKPVTSSRSLDQFGTYDLAGNVKEWSSSEVGESRYLMGGAWNEPVYMFIRPDAASAFARAPTHGFRCARYVRPPSKEALAPVQLLSIERKQPQPVDDATFDIFKSLYMYERRDLEIQVESVEDAPYWTHETVSYDAGYGDERVLAHLFLPKQGKPPFQTVIYFPYGWAMVQKSSREMEMHWVGFLLRSGRAVLCPVFQGTYERRAKLPEGISADWRIDWVKDLGRSIDYLETREDIDAERIAFYGFSLGAVEGPVFAVLEPRLKTLVLLAGGLPEKQLPPQVDPVHFAPRTTKPVLMINGKDDFFLHNASRQLFDLLGTPPDQKRLTLLEGGHALANVEDVIREVLDWLDRYLGPV